MPTINGSAGNDTLNGTAGDDFLYGFDGDDQLLGGDGNDQLFGSNGNDSLSGGNGSDALYTGLGSDTLDGGPGYDTVYLTEATGPVVADLAAGSASAASGTATLIAIEGLVGSALDDSLTGDAGDNLLNGSDGNDTLAGGAGIDTLLGGLGNDSLSGGADSDNLTGGAGNDTLDGGAATDTVRYDGLDVTGGITVDLAKGTASGPGIGNDVLLNVETVLASKYDDVLVGDANKNAFQAGDGNDSVAAGGGDDYTNARGGNDTIDGGDGQDSAQYSGARADYTVSYNAANATFTITDKVAGRDGSDQVVNVEAFYFTDGVLTAQQLQAGATSPDTTPPTLSASSPANAAVGVAPAADITLSFSEAITLGEGSITLRDADGNVVDKYGPGSNSLSVQGNTLTINPSADLLPSTGYTLEVSAGIVRDLAGNAYIGNSGAALYHFTTAGSGTTQTATAQAPNLTGGTGDDTLIAGPGNGTLDGGAGNDVLLGSSGHTTMLGGSGNDTLISGTGGGDTMAGGDGADLYYVNSAGDLVIETASNTAQPTEPTNPGPGLPPDADVARTVDKVIASINYTLTDFVENLSLASGSGATSGAGNALNNVLAGNEGNNTLAGKGGNDTIDGAGGLDTATYTGKLAEYTVAQANGSTSVTDKTANRDGADSLSNVERLKFSDASLALDLGATQAGGKAVLMMAVATSLGPAFINLPTYAGLFLGYFDTGASLLDGATLLVSSGIIAAFAGGADNTSLVKMVYNDVYGKAPDAATLAGLVAPLNAGTISQAQWLANMAASTDNQQHVGLAGYAGTGLAYLP